ncbi:MAG TPA: alpha/beta hydrolase-fold protein [Telluria sp.]|nr:alpha/beta hydrolase-fold protein [Telluria sp.]
MNKRTLLGLAAASILATSAARAGELIQDEFGSAVLGRKVALNVYLPDGYAQGANYPVIYLLHGAGGNETEWAANGGVVQTLDGMIRRGEIRPTVAVMPTTGGGTWWVDGAVDKAETAFMRELLPHVERKYKVSGARGARAIGGQSMGGYGALHMALKFPDKFCGAAILSPAIYDPLPPSTSASRLTAQFQRNGKFDEALWKSLNYPTLLPAYQRGAVRVPMWIASGDHDHLGIAVESANLYWKLFQVQPKQVELRITDGDHEWPAFNATFPDALRYIDANCVRNR